MKITEGTYAGTSFDVVQAGWAEQVINTCFAYPDATDRDAVAALACVMQESSFYMYANDGTSTALTPEQKTAIRESLSYPYDKVGHSSASVGLFQQQPYIPGRTWGWGTIAQCMDPVYSTKAFLGPLLRISDRASKPITVLVQTVQRSAFPNAYAKWEQFATELVKLARTEDPAQEPLPSPTPTPEPAPSTPPPVSKVDLDPILGVLTDIQTGQSELIALLKEVRGIFR